jgi:hypothetical protein
VRLAGVWKTIAFQTITSISENHRFTLCFRSWGSFRSGEKSNDLFVKSLPAVVYDPFFSCQTFEPLSVDALEDGLFYMVRQI